MIFISHRETERKLAEALVELLLGSLAIPENDIRCTSVPGFQLPYGRSIAEQLKLDITSADAVFAILTRESLDSKWVLFELGASWALGKTLIPILGPNVAEKDLPTLVSQYPIVRTTSDDAASRMRDAIGQVATEFNLTEKSGGRTQAKLEDFIRVFRGWRDFVIPPTDGAKAFELGWLIVWVYAVVGRHLSQVAEIEIYTSEFGLQLPSSWKEALWGNDWDQLQELIGSLDGQLRARRPRLLRYYRAAIKLASAGVTNDGSDIDEIISELNLPLDVAVGSDVAARVDSVHHYFSSILEGGS